MGRLTRDSTVCGAGRSRLLLAGLAWEAATRRRQLPRVSLQSPARLYLGRAQAATLRFVHDAPRAQRIEYAPAVPAGFATAGAPRVLALPPGVATDDPLELLPLRLGEHAWPALPARRLGRFELAWWTFVLGSGAAARVAPDTLRRHDASCRRHDPWPAGAARRRRRLRAAAVARRMPRAIRCRASTGRPRARAGELVTREFSEDQHLDILVAIDAGRLSRVGAGRLDRLGLFANVAARFAEAAVLRDDRIGLLAFSDGIARRLSRRIAGRARSCACASVSPGWPPAAPNPIRSPRRSRRGGC